MSQLKSLRQDVMNSFQHNITEGNIDDITQEIIQNTKLNIKIEVSNDNYMCYGSNIIIPHMTHKISGFGRTEYEAMKTSIINLIDQLLQEERYLNPIRDSIKLFTLNNKTKTRNKKASNYHITSKPDHSVSSDLKLLSQSTSVMAKEISFELPAVDFSYKELIKEKDLILKEMDNLVMDIMTYCKNVIDYFEQGTSTENIPKYYKCPISWELMENPVVSSEGHSYEKWAIDKWLTAHNKSPITGLAFEESKMIHNYTLKYAIDDFCLRQVRMKKMKIELQKFLIKCEYDLSDLRKYFNTPSRLKSP